MLKEGDLLLIFASIHRIMAAEQLLLEADLPITLIPAPRAISNDCGMALRLLPHDWPQVQQCLQQQSLMPEQIYLYQDQQYVAQGGQGPVPGCSTG